MGGRVAIIVLFAIAVLLPPAGLLIGLLQLTQGDRQHGYRLIAVAILAAAVWALLIFG